MVKETISIKMVEKKNWQYFNYSSYIVICESVTLTKNIICSTFITLS